MEKSYLSLAQYRFLACVLFLIALSELEMKVWSVSNDPFGSDTDPGNPTMQDFTSVNIKSKMGPDDRK